MLIIIGTTIKEKVREQHGSGKICPFCGEKTNLIDLKQYLTLFFIPVFPFKNIGYYYSCPSCNYKTELTKYEN
ncbi:MAG: zinc-ribbon domain-containing protein [Chlorobi bacterium]|nr:zinc-ribbon domain-containing protein [Chlorobiota bacterium]